MLFVVVTYVRGEQPPRPRRDVVVTRGTDYEMHVIRHEAGAKDWQFEALLRPLYQADECRIVCRFMENFGTSIRAIEDVVALVGEYEARRARHPDEDMPDGFSFDVGKRW
jgi:hypothetical protein